MDNKEAAALLKTLLNSIAEARQRGATERALIETCKVLASHAMHDPEATSDDLIAYWSDMLRINLPPYIKAFKTGFEQVKKGLPVDEAINMVEALVAKDIADLKKEML